MSVSSNFGLSISISAIFITCFILSADICVQANENDAESITKIGQGVGHIMNIYYCYSCGYRKVFEDYAGIIQQKYPGISVIGANYDPPGLNMYMSRMIGLGKMILIMCILSGVNIFAWLNKPQPSWWTWCLENKLYACMMMFFLANMIEGQLVSSGAFEISLNNIPLWSKLETGRIPQPPELFQIIDNTLQFSKVEMPNNNFIQ
ncbi:thioredoxin reductase-like selenoprotein T homolog CG3887 [Plodia interpunctella]|uniref:thioredoxin reductase-like selenoprotein T homolog CG3887 n=1 Tax=Plodia interpunctella TaxID=58824 RepID=UPI002368D947|nr:thioredoxin reductase-like selenoprotein T homolog CG3887 [Plodia interpunctella]